MRRVRILASVVLALVLGAYCARYYIRGQREAQWDFKIYYAAASVAAAGDDPYDLANLRHAALGGRAAPDHPFVYPPLALYPLRVFTWLDLETARALFFGLKLVALGLLIWLWRAIVPEGPALLFPAFCLVAYSTSALRDVIAGNVSVFEQCLLWAAFWIYIRGGRPFAFGALVCLAAAFKLVLILFLLLLLAEPVRQRVRACFACGLSFVVAEAAPLLAAPGRASVLLARLSERGDEGGAINPTLYALLHRLSPVGGTLAAVGCATALALAALWVWRAAAERLGSERRRLLVFWSTVCFALVVPRMKDYSLLLLVPATYYVLWKLWPRSGPIIGLIAFELAGTQLCPIYRDGHWPATALLRFAICEYRGLWLVIATWLAYLILFVRKRRAVV